MDIVLRATADFLATVGNPLRQQVLVCDDMLAAVGDGDWGFFERPIPSYARHGSAGVIPECVVLPHRRRDDSVHAQLSEAVSAFLQERLAVPDKHCDSVDETTLHILAAKGTARLLEAVLRSPLLRVDVNAGAASIPLHMAVERGSLEVVDVLMAYGARVNARNAVHETPLHLASSSNNPDMIFALVTKHGCHLDEEDDGGYTPLQSAFMEENMASVEILLCLGADGMRVVQSVLENPFGGPVDTMQEWPLLYCMIALDCTPIARSVYMRNMRCVNYWLSRGVPCAQRIDPSCYFINGLTRIRAEGLLEATTGNTYIVRTTETLGRASLCISVNFAGGVAIKHYLLRPSVLPGRGVTFAVQGSKTKPYATAAQAVASYIEYLERKHHVRLQPIKHALKACTHDHALTTDLHLSSHTHEHFGLPLVDMARDASTWPVNNDIVDTLMRMQTWSPQAHMLYCDHSRAAIRAILLVIHRTASGPFFLPTELWMLILSYFTPRTLGHTRPGAWRELSQPLLRAWEHT